MSETKLPTTAELEAMKTEDLVALSKRLAAEAHAILDQTPDQIPDPRGDHRE